MYVFYGMILAAPKNGLVVSKRLLSYSHFQFIFRTGRYQFFLYEIENCNVNCRTMFAEISFTSSCVVMRSANHLIHLQSVLIKLLIYLRCEGFIS